MDLGDEFGVADAQLQAMAAHRLQMRSAHHAGDLMAGARQPDRKMAADRARAEDANPHGVPSNPGCLVSTAAAWHNPPCDGRDRPSANKDGSAF
jgi:hypothetical protein